MHVLSGFSNGSVGGVFTACVAFAALTFLVSGESLDNYKEIQWTRHSVEEALHKFSHIIHCEPEDTNSTCSQVSCSY